jgi:hypothetical protein
MEKYNKPQIEVRVDPRTTILIDADRNPEEAKYLWLKAHALTPPLSMGGIDQQRRERVNVRCGKVSQRTHIKR